MVLRLLFPIAGCAIIGALVVWQKTLHAADLHAADAAHESATVGWWGPIDATMDWCEANYVVTPYVAEFFNAVSSMPMIVLGLCGIVLERRHARTGERRFVFAFGGLAVVGVGSTMFHASLRYHYQLLDELPMLYCNGIFLYCQLRYDKPAPRAGEWDRLAVGLAALGAFQTFAYGYLGWYTVFIVSYAGGVLAQWHFFLFTRGGFRALSPAMRRFFVTLVVCYNGGLVLWSLEHVFCEQVRAWQFHALWHLGAGYGTFMWCMFLVVCRCEYLIAVKAKKEEGGKQLAVTIERLHGFGLHYALVSDKV